VKVVADGRTIRFVQPHQYHTSTEKLTNEQL
jgi:hypothetical protein